MQKNIREFRIASNLSTLKAIYASMVFVFVEKSMVYHINKNWIICILKTAKEII